MINNKSEESELQRFGDIIRPGIARELDFVIIEELRKRTGVSPDNALGFALRELICNALDKDALNIDVRLQPAGDFYMLYVGDNGSKKLSIKEIEMILDFSTMASSKKGLLQVSRGYLGNALKCIFGYSYVLTESKSATPQPIIILSGEFEYRIHLKPDRVKGVINYEIETIKREDDGYTAFILNFPLENEVQKLKDIVFSISMVNPNRQISCNILNENVILGSAQESQKLRNETCILWYTQKQFESLFEDFVRAVPEAPIKDLIAMFRGFSSKKIIREILQRLGSEDHDSKGNQRLQFLPATPIKDFTKENISQLFTLMKDRAKPISKRSIPSVLGCVGKEAFEKVREQNGWKTLRYIMTTCISLGSRRRTIFEPSSPDEEEVEYPYLIELAIFDRNNDNKGLKVYQCVNFMASSEEIFSYIYDVKVHLAKVGIREETPVTVIVHLICPVLKWLNYGKSALDD